MSSIIKYVQVSEGEKICIKHDITEENFVIDEQEEEQFILSEKQQVEIKQDEAVPDTKQILISAQAESEAIIETARKYAEQQKSEARQYCEELIKTQEEQFLKQQKEFLLQQELFEEQKKMFEIEMKKEQEALEVQQKEIIKAAQLEKEEILQSAEPEVVHLITKLLEIVLGECSVGVDWITLLVRKAIREEKLEMPMTLYISEAYAIEEADKLRMQIQETLGDITVQTKIELDDKQIEIETPLGSMLYDLTQNSKDLLRQLSLLNK